MVVTNIRCAKGQHKFMKLERPLVRMPIVCHLPGGHLQPPYIGHLPPPKTVHLPGGQLPPPIFFFLAHFSWLFRLTAYEGHQGWKGGGA